MASSSSFLHAFARSFVEFSSRSCFGLTVSQVERITGVVALIVLRPASDESGRHSFVKFPFFYVFFGFVLTFSFSFLSFAIAFALALLLAFSSSLGGAHLLASLPQVVPPDPLL